jgi:hypothetical protein
MTGETTNGSASFIHFGPQPDRESVGKKKENTSSPTGSNHSLVGFEYSPLENQMTTMGGVSWTWTCLWRSFIALFWTRTRLISQNTQILCKYQLTHRDIQKTKTKN